MPDEVQRVPTLLDTVQDLMDRQVANSVLTGSSARKLRRGSARSEHPDRETDRESYVVTYLEEEVRSEALVRDVGLFGRFFELASDESGRITSFHKLSRQVGIRFWRGPDGPEVDWVIEKGGRYTPIEVKWSDAPSPRDARHAQVFLDEYPNSHRGYVICQTPRQDKLAPNVAALPCQELPGLI